MTTRERRADRGKRRSRESLAQLGREARYARLRHGLSQVNGGRAVGRSGSWVSLFERGRLPAASVRDVSRLMAVLGMDLLVRTLPAGDPVRDRRHLELLGRLRARLPASAAWATEVPLPNQGDPRAWDALTRAEGRRVAIEAETAPRDLQALERRLALKVRDGGVDRLILLLADTRSNRALLRAHGDGLRGRFPVRGRDALAALSGGRDPGGDAIIVL